MIVIITGNFAHRLLRNGLVESTTVEDMTNEDEKGREYPVRVINNEAWRQRALRDMNLMDGELYTVRQVLANLNVVIPDDRGILPTPGPETEKPTESTVPV